MIYWVLALGIGWIIFAAIATSAMLATVAVKDGMSALKGAFWSQLPAIIGMASPGIFMVLVAGLSLALVKKRPENRK